MHILITDSGVGGLSVVAYAERFARTRGVGEPLRLTFANAAPENDYGYNSMASREVKLETFDRFLRNVTERYSPDQIYVACNTLSVLLPDTPFARMHATQEARRPPAGSRRAAGPATGEARPAIQGIVETGVSLVADALASDASSIAMIFATQTTIDAGAYPRMLVERGVEPSRIVSQACPGLADTISEDRAGERTRAEIEMWVATAMEKMPRSNAPIVACLACTHYGYRKDVFAEALGSRATVINPNESAVHDIFGAARGDVHDVQVEFVTRYRIPAATIEALTYYLEELSPKTVNAMRNFAHVPDLF